MYQVFLCKFGFIVSRIKEHLMQPNLQKFQSFTFDVKLCIFSYKFCLFFFVHVLQPCPICQDMPHCVQANWQHTVRMLPICVVILVTFMMLNYFLALLFKKVSVFVQSCQDFCTDPYLFRLSQVTSLALFAWLAVFPLLTLTGSSTANVWQVGRSFTMNKKQ